MSLSEIADRSRIPATLLRELEWGDLRNWPTGPYGRTQLVRYARAAGLDDQLVVSTAWPLLEEWAGQVTASAPVRAIEPAKAVEKNAASATHETPATALATIPFMTRASRTRRWARKEARDRGLLELLIDEQGRVVGITVRMSIHPLYDPLLIAAAREWRYKPAMFSGTPVKFRKLIQVSVDKK
jgi:hypothetical protein